MMALKRLPKETFGILISMEPAVAALWAMLLLHEHLHGLQWLAIGCTVLASVGSTMTARRLKAPRHRLKRRRACWWATGVQRDPDVAGMMALKRLPKETFGILISMEPAVAALWAMLLLHEHLHGLQWLAIGCTVLASVGSTMTARRLKAPVTA